MLGKGKAAPISDADIAALADQLQCHPADLEAIAEVESRGFGWFKDGRIKILVEKHWFYKYLKGQVRAEAVAAGLARKRWIHPKRGGYREQKTAAARYEILAAMMKIDAEAAMKSISVGKFQIMGFNHGICGYASAGAMFKAFCAGEAEQLAAFGNFLRAKSAVEPLRRRRFDQVETIYNGGGLGGAYARKMKTESDKLRAGKWAGYKPGQMEPPPPALPAPRPGKIPVDQPGADAGLAGLIALVGAAIAAAAVFIYCKIRRKKQP